MSRTRFHWFLPTGGDGRSLASGVHGIGIGGATRTAAARPASLEYLTQLAQAADSLGYEAVLTPTGAHCADAWIVTSALIAATRRLKLPVSGFSPCSAAQRIERRLPPPYQGREPVGDFLRACAEEDRRVAAGWSAFWHYIRLGRYGEQLDHLFGLFPRGSRSSSSGTSAFWLSPRGCWMKSARSSA